MPADSCTNDGKRYSSSEIVKVTTPDVEANRAIKWAQIALEQAWTCNARLGCALVAGYGPSHPSRRPQYAWFFAGDGLLATEALLREGNYKRAADELAFLYRYQKADNGMMWHEISQSAGSELGDGLSLHVYSRRHNLRFSNRARRIRPD